MKDIKKRLKYILLGLVVPLLLATIIVGILCFKYWSVFFPDRSGIQDLPKIVTDTTLDPQDRVETLFIEYVVKDGDTLKKIAQLHEISVNAIIWANLFLEDTDIKVGDILNIPTFDGLTITVKEGDTIYNLAKKYKIVASEIADKNLLEYPYELKIGELIILPGAKPIEAKKTTPSKQTTVTETKDWWEYPDKIYTVTRSGNDLLVLVNKEYKLSSSYAPSDLILAEKSGIRVKSKGTYYVRKELKSHLMDLDLAAKADGVDISIISAYRSYATQKSTYNYWVNYNKGCMSCADKLSARAGHSQHQLGTAVDFGTKENGDQVGSTFDNTKAAKWLTSNAYKYGFVISYPKGYEEITGYSFESWHYRYIGVDNALEMKDRGKILEKWLHSKN